MRNHDPMQSFFDNPPKIGKHVKGNDKPKGPPTLRPGASKEQASKFISDMIEEDLENKTVKLDAFSTQYKVVALLCAAFVIGYMYNLIKEENHVTSNERISKTEMVNEEAPSWENWYGLKLYFQKLLEENYERSHVRVKYNKHPVGVPIVYGNIEGFPILIYRITKTPLDKAEYGVDFIVNMARDPLEGIALLPVPLNEIDPKLIAEQFGVRKPEHPHLPYVLYSYSTEKVYTMDNAPEYRDDTYNERIFKRPVMVHPLFYQVNAEQDSLTLTRGSFIKNNFSPKSFERIVSDDRAVIQSWDAKDRFVAVKPEQTIVKQL